MGVVWLTATAVPWSRAAGRRLTDRRRGLSPMPSSRIRSCDSGLVMVGLDGARMWWRCLSGLAEQCARRGDGNRRGRNAVASYCPALRIWRCALARSAHAPSAWRADRNPQQPAPPPRRPHFTRSPRRVMTTTALSRGGADAPGHRPILASRGCSAPGTLKRSWPSGGRRTRHERSRDTDSLVAEFARHPGAVATVRFDHLSPGCSCAARSGQP